MVKESIYLDLSKLSTEELKQIPNLCDEFSLIIITQYRDLLYQGLFNEKMPFLFYSTEFKLFSCTFVRHHSKSEIQFSELRDILSDTFANEIHEAETPEEKAEAIINLLDTFNLSSDQKLEILATTRKRLENEITTIHSN